MRKKPQIFAARNLLRFATLLRFANGDAANVNEKIKDKL